MRRRYLQTLPILFACLYSNAYAGMPECKTAFDAKNFEGVNQACEAIATQGDPVAQHYMGVTYYRFEGDLAIRRKAVVWLQLAANQGYVNSLRELGYVYEEGSLVEKNKSEALRLYLAAAEQGDKIAQYNVAVCYQTGIGTSPSYKEASRWYQKSAEQGYADAQYRIGLAFRYGEGVPIDKLEELKWIRAAADQKNADAAYQMSHAYYFGDLLPRDLALSLDWARKAIDYGSSEARKFLRLLEQEAEIMLPKGEVSA